MGRSTFEKAMEGVGQALAIAGHDRERSRLTTIREERLLAQRNKQAQGLQASKQAHDTELQGKRFDFEGSQNELRREIDRINAETSKLSARAQAATNALRAKSEATRAEADLSRTESLNKTDQARADYYRARADKTDSEIEDDFEFDGGGDIGEGRAWLESQKLDPDTVLKNSDIGFDAFTSIMQRAPTVVAPGREQPGMVAGDKLRSKVTGEIIEWTGDRFVIADKQSGGGTKPTRHPGPRRPSSNSEGLESD